MPSLQQTLLTLISSVAGSYLKTESTKCFRLFGAHSPICLYHESNESYKTWLVRSNAEVKVEMTAVQRIQNYTRLNKVCEKDSFIQERFVRMFKTQFVPASIRLKLLYLVLHEFLTWNQLSEFMFLLLVGLGVAMLFSQNYKKRRL